MRSFTRGHLDMATRVGIIAANVVSDAIHGPGGIDLNREAVLVEVYDRLWKSYDKLAVETFIDRTRVRSAVDMAFDMEGLR